MNTNENGTPTTGTDAPAAETLNDDQAAEVLAADAAAQADVTPITAAAGTGSKRSRARKSTTSTTSKPKTGAKPKPKTTPKPKATPKPKPVRKPKPEVPAGWTAPLGHRTYMIKRIAAPAEGESAWGVMCRAHGTIYGKPVASITEGDKIAAKPNRPAWCRQCKTEQAAKA